VFTDTTPIEELGDYNGPTYWKIPEFNYPTGEDSNPYVLDMRS
jgi:hypothetical protein